MHPYKGQAQKSEKSKLRMMGRHPRGIDPAVARTTSNKVPVRAHERIKPTGVPGMKSGGRLDRYARGGKVPYDVPRSHAKKDGQAKIPFVVNDQVSTLNEAQQKKFLKRASGGAVRGKFPKKMEYGAGSGEGRLEKID